MRQTAALPNGDISACGRGSFVYPAAMAVTRAVIFDLDETLTDRPRSIDRFAPIFSKEFESALAGPELSEIVQRICEADGCGYATRDELCTHLRSALPWRNPPTVEELVEFWRKRFPPCSVEREGATATLRELHDRGFKLGLITNGSPTQHVKIAAMGLATLFSVVIVSDEVGMKKPDPRIFRMALQKLAVTAADAIFVGDNPELDIAGALGVNMRAIWLNAGNRKPLAGVETIRTLGELLTLVEQNGNAAT